MISLDFEGNSQTVNLMPIYNSLSILQGEINDLSTNTIAREYYSKMSDFSTEEYLYNISDTITVSGSAKNIYGPCIYSGVNQVGKIALDIYKVSNCSFHDNIGYTDLSCSTLLGNTFSYGRVDLNVADASSNLFENIYGIVSANTFSNNTFTANTMDIMAPTFSKNQLSLGLYTITAKENTSNKFSSCNVDLHGAGIFNNVFVKDVMNITGMSIANNAYESVSQLYATGREMKSEVYSSMSMMNLNGNTIHRNQLELASSIKIQAIEFTYNSFEQMDILKLNVKSMYQNTLSICEKMKNYASVIGGNVIKDVSMIDETARTIINNTYSSIRSMNQVVLDSMSNNNYNYINSLKIQQRLNNDSTNDNYTRDRNCSNSFYNISNMTYDGWCANSYNWVNFLSLGGGIIGGTQTVSNCQFVIFDGGVPATCYNVKTAAFYPGALNYVSGTTYSMTIPRGFVNNTYHGYV